MIRKKNHTQTPEWYPTAGHWVVLKVLGSDQPVQGLVAASGPHGILLKDAGAAITWTSVWAFDTYTDAGEWRDMGDSYTAALMSSSHLKVVDQ